MARYGRDFSTGRDRNRHFGDSGGGYDADYGRGFGGRGDWYSNRGYGSEMPRGNRSWEGFNRPYGDFDQPWRSMNPPRERFSGNYRERFGIGGYDRDSAAGRIDRGFADRQRFGYGGYPGHEYDDDFRDRLRRGWERFRNEAREWMGRGYDRDW